MASLDLTISLEKSWQDNSLTTVYTDFT